MQQFNVRAVEVVQLDRSQAQDSDLPWPRCASIKFSVVNTLRESEGQKKNKKKRQNQINFKEMK